MCGVRDAVEVDNDQSLPGAAVVVYSMTRESGNTVFLSIPADVGADFSFTIKEDFIIFHKRIFQEHLLNSTTTSHLQLGKDRKRLDNDELGGLIRWCTHPPHILFMCSCGARDNAKSLMLFKLKMTDCVPGGAPGVGFIITPQCQ